MPIAPNVVDPVIWKLYDTFDLAAGAGNPMPTEFVFFNGIGARTKASTNVEQAQRLPDPEWMNVWSVGFSLGPEVILPDILPLLSNYYYEFWVGEKVYDEGPLLTAPGGVGLYGATATAGEYIYSLGHPSLGNVQDLRLPPPIGDGIIGITILQGQRFRVKLIGATYNLTAGPAGLGMHLKCYLYGVKSRGVQ